jgi:hypothetical protein
MLRQYCPRTVQPDHEPSRILVDKYLLGPKQAAYSALSCKSCCATQGRTMTVLMPTHFTCAPPSRYLPLQQHQYLSCEAFSPADASIKSLYAQYCTSQPAYALLAALLVCPVVLIHRKNRLYLGSFMLDFRLNDQPRSKMANTS